MRAMMNVISERERNHQQRNVSVSFITFFLSVWIRKNAFLWMWKNEMRNTCELNALRIVLRWCCMLLQFFSLYHFELDSVLFRWARTMCCSFYAIFFDDSTLKFAAIFVEQFFFLFSSSSMLLANCEQRVE